MSRFKETLRKYEAVLQGMVAAEGSARVIVCGYSTFLINKFQADLAHGLRDRKIIRKHESFRQLHQTMESRQGTDLFGDTALDLVRLKSWSAAQAKEFAAADTAGPLIVTVEKPVTERALGLKKSKDTDNRIQVLETSDPWPSEIPFLAGWLGSRLGLSLNPGQCSQLAAALGSDLATLDNEIRHLAMFNSTDGPDRGAITAMLASSHFKGLAEKNLFLIQDLLARREVPALHHLMQDLVSRGEAPLAILGLIQRTYATALGMAHSGPFAGLGPTRGGQSPAALKKAEQAISQLGEKTLWQLYKNCQWADLLLKGDERIAALALQKTLPL